MKLLSAVLVLSLAGAPASALAQTARISAHGGSRAQVEGFWQGTANVRAGVDVPVAIRITGSGADLKLALLNGPAAHPDESPASSVTFDGAHLVAAYDYFARKLDATVSGDTLSGTYGPAKQGGRGTPATLTLHRVSRLTDPASAPGAPSLQGSWEIPTTNSKGVPFTWEFRVDPPAPGTPVIKAVIQRIDGDTGGLWGVWNGTSYTVGHFTAAGAALWSVTPQADGTLLVKNLLAPAAHPATAETAGTAPGPRASEYVARRPEDARAHNVPRPADPTQHTTVKDPSVPFAFSFPDLSGRVVSNTDPEFRGKVVIVAIGGSWCPNCHDEAPFLVSLYRQFHARGLEIVGLDFEQGDPETDTARLKAFIAHYGIPYPMLLAGSTDELNEKIPQGVNLSYWPTSFFLGRDGRVREAHAGFAGPGNTAGHLALERDVTALVESLLAEPAPKETVGRAQP